jgi:hypothetical protein
MLKFIAIFVLIVLNCMPIDAELLNNSSMNDTLLNIMRLNNTSLNNTTSDDDWFNRASNLSFGLPLNPLSDSIRIMEDEQAGVKFPAEETIAEKLIWDMINPPDITIPDPVIDIPKLSDGPYEGGCSEPVCDEDGICFSECIN